MDGYHRNNKNGNRNNRGYPNSSPSGQGSLSPSSSETDTRGMTFSPSDSASPPISRPSSADLYRTREQSSVKYYDNRYIILKTGQLNETEVRNLVQTLIKTVEQKLGHSLINVGFEINVVRDSKIDGFDGYKKNTVVFFSDATVANVIVGLDPDGKERFMEQVIAPPPPPPQVELPPGTKKSWADMMDEDDALQPIIKRVPLEPLIKLPFVSYVGKALEWNQARPEKYTGVQIEAMRCWVMDPPEGFARHVLCFTGDCHPNITEEDIQKHFRAFATDALTEVEFHFGRDKFWSKYPMVRFKSEYNEKQKRVMKNVYIYFDRNTRDAAFALKMRKHFVVKGRQLAFSHAITDKTY